LKVCCICEVLRIWSGSGEEALAICFTSQFALCAREGH
jgi:hypothetical protein